MAQSVSNDALWVKLSEIEDKVIEALTAKKVPAPEQNRQVEISAALKEEIIETIREEIRKYSQSDASYLERNEKNIKILYNGILKIQEQTKQASQTQAQMPKTDEPKEPPAKDKQAYLDLVLFKIRKTSAIITILGLLVFILTLFCMKQQNDYSLLNYKCYKQSVVIERMRVEIDTSIKVEKTVKPTP
ncbi:MAG: hypothetical protein LBL79_13850 [Prevotella sp.]|jgi:hypothetical protein|nr:hypothetical protein [Prevotella sp.]